LLDIRLELWRGEPGSFALRREVLNEDRHALQASQRLAREVAIVGTTPQRWQTEKTPQNGQSDEDAVDAGGRVCVLSHGSPFAVGRSVSCLSTHLIGERPQGHEL